MKKPNCPLCDSEVELSELSFSGVSSNSSVLLGGLSKNIRYICSCNFDTCSASITIFNSVMHKNKHYERIVGNANNWRDALKRYKYYVDFIVDHQILKDKLMMLADDEFRIRSDWSFLIES